MLSVAGLARMHGHEKIPKKAPPTFSLSVFSLRYKTAVLSNFCDYVL